jgi:hypothetical protein
MLILTDTRNVHKWLKCANFRSYPDFSFCTALQHQGLVKLMQVQQCFLFFYCAGMKVTKNISTF